LRRASRASPNGEFNPGQVCALFSSSSMRRDDRQDVDGGTFFLDAAAAAEKV
jgi:hypothetical protein